MPKIKTKAATTKKIQTTKHWPSNNWLLFWLLVMANVALVCAIFGNVDVRTLKDGEIETTSSDLEISQLNDQVNSLKDKLDNAESQIAASNNPINACLSENHSKIDNYLSYSDEEETVTFKVPFSTLWKAPDCTAPAPADILSGGVVYFGPFVGKEEFFFEHDSVIFIQNEKRTAAEERELLQNPSEGTVTNIKEQTVSGIPVFSFTVDGYAGHRKTWVALGRNNTYMISTRGWLTDTEAIKIIQSLRVTK